MSDSESQAPLGRIRAQARAGDVRVTQHAHQEMVEEEITLVEVLEAIDGGKLLEDYPQHRRGPCCLVGGITRHGRPLHMVCTTGQPVLILITTYEPTPPKWITPTRRGGHGNAVQH